LGLLSYDEYNPTTVGFPEHAHATTMKSARVTNELGLADNRFAVSPKDSAVALAKLD
jgi:hypothetical protein